MFDTMTYPLGKPHPFRLSDHQLPDWYRGMCESQESTIEVQEVGKEEWCVLVNDELVVGNLPHFFATMVAIGIKESFQREVIHPLPNNEFKLNIDHPNACY